MLGGEVNVGIWREEGGVEPVVVVIAIDGVSSQLVMGQLLLQQADDLDFRKVGAIAHVWREDGEMSPDPVMSSLLLLN